MKLTALEYLYIYICLIKIDYNIFFQTARSLASVAHRRANDKRYSFHFNYYTIDFNEVRFLFF